MYVNPVVGILENHSLEYRKDVKILFFHMFSESSMFEVLLLYLFIWKHLISVTSAQEILYNHV